MSWSVSKSGNYILPPNVFLQVLFLFICLGFLLLSLFGYLEAVVFEEHLSGFKLSGTFKNVP